MIMLAISPPVNEIAASFSTKGPEGSAIPAKPGQVPVREPAIRTSSIPTCHPTFLPSFKVGQRLARNRGPASAEKNGRLLPEIRVV